MTPIDIAVIRTRLAEHRGPRYWRSLEELAETEEFHEILKQEFPKHAAVWVDSVSRRRFLQLMGASLALGGLSACTKQPTELIVPYTKPPESLLPGRPQYYATAVLFHGVATGVLVESHTGRPTKIEGNPLHPASLGSTDALTQAAILNLYDPDRAQIVSNAGRISTWDGFTTAIKPALDEQLLKQGAGLRILTETTTSPTFASQMEALAQLFPQVRWHQYEPLGRDAVRQGARLAFGEDVDTHYRLAKADVVLSLDADFLFSMPGSARYTRDFSAKRKVHHQGSHGESHSEGHGEGHDSHHDNGHGGGSMNRLYTVESSPSLTGAMADHRIALRAHEVELFARAVAKELGVSGVEVGQWSGNETYAKQIAAIGRDLRQHLGSSVIIAGDYQPAVVHALAHAINAELGNVGQTVIYTDPINVNPTVQGESLRELAQDMTDGKVELLVILGGNPVYNAPADIRFAELLNKVAVRVHCSSHADETTAHCHWHIPEAHTLEAWSDARAYDGTVSVIQPLIAPLFGSKSHHEVVAALLGQTSASGYDLVRKQWEGKLAGDNFDRAWRRALHDGIIEGSAFPAKNVTLASINWPAATESKATAIELIFRPDPTVGDGRFSNNGWLQELPKPLTKLTWDNAALVGPALAQRLDLHDQDLVELTYQKRTLRVPIWTVPGHPDNAVTLHLGYGRTHAGRVGSGAGFNAYAIQTIDAPWAGSGVTIRKTGERFNLSCTQAHYNMEGRNLLRIGTVAEYQKNPQFVHEMGHDPAPDMTLYPPVEYKDNAWGMTIDLSSCIGCNACTMACQSENNIPVVGKEQVAKNREMHWIRIDRYYSDDLDNPGMYHQPVTCMQCENAPCEPVCPVGATVHSSEGLNDMVYNRCVGTRYCSNNCPYKVRRFNFLLFQDWETETLKMQRNPNVSVRSRGVMEKCTYCVQRINFARITAEKEDRKIHDGEIVTACQAACPAQAIAFGNINDKESEVAKLKASHLNYGLLTDLNTRPRTTYLARLRNPNPEIENG
jgi:MoCo/4Fe-4S cofactor protein with predicted Tat translocation signal